MVVALLTRCLKYSNCTYIARNLYLVYTYLHVPNSTGPFYIPGYHTDDMSILQQFCSSGTQVDHRIMPSAQRTSEDDNENTYIDDVTID